MSAIVIAGLGSAGYAALTAVKRHNPRAEIIIIDPKEHDLSHPCGLPYSLEGKVDASRLEQDIALNRMGVRKERGRIASIKGGRLTVSMEQDGEPKDIAFERLILCLGSRPVVPPVAGLSEMMGSIAFTLHDCADLNAIGRMVETGSSGIVIGGGAIGLETAMALAERRKSVTVVEMKEQVLPGILDEDLANTVEEYLKNSGVTVITGSAVSGVSASASGLTASHSGGDVSANFCIVSAGFAPDTAPAADSGIDCNDNGIIVDESLRTSLNDVYAAGDCISNWSVVNGSLLRAKLATSAYKQGTVAGLNAAGSEASYPGSAGTFVTKIGGLEVAGTGFTYTEALQQGFAPRQGKIKSHILPDYFPGNSEIQVKIIVDGNSGRILGAQAVGPRGAAERINIASTAVEFGLTVDDMARIEMAYCPAVSEVYDPLLRAVDFARRRKRQ